MGQMSSKTGRKPGESGVFLGVFPAKTSQPRAKNDLLPRQRSVILYNSISRNHGTFVLYPNKNRRAQSEKSPDFPATTHDFVKFRTKKAGYL